MKRALIAFALATLGCGATVQIADSRGDADTQPDSPADASTDTLVTDAPPTGSGDLGAPCASDGECLAGFCLVDIGRCSRACKASGACPNSSNWSCLVVPKYGPMCVCDALSKTEVACNGIDDNCDGVIDEGSPTCGTKCVDVNTDPSNCGKCGVVCGDGKSCVGGACTCTAGTACGDACVDTKSDPKNCGTCGKACAMGEACVAGACTKSVALDVTLLLDTTGSTAASLSTALPTLRDKLATPLLAITDTHVGVSRTCEFPDAPYGSAGDRPFTGVVQPTTSSTEVLDAISKTVGMGGGDAPDGMVEALGTLSGLAAHPASLALTCSPGRVSGGCWRASAKKIVVLFTDDIFHNGPDPLTTGLYSPYAGITPAPVDWPAVKKAMLDAKITLLIINTAVDANATAQHKKMLSELGQPETDVFFAGTKSENIGIAVDGVIARIKSIKSGG